MEKTPGNLIIGDKPTIYCDCCQKEAIIPEGVNQKHFVSNGWLQLDKIKIFASKKAKIWAAKLIQTHISEIFQSDKDIIGAWFTMICKQNKDIIQPFISYKPLKSHFSEVQILQKFLQENDPNILDNLIDTIFIGSGDFCPDCIQIILKNFPELFEKTACNCFRPRITYSKKQTVIHRKNCPKFIEMV